MEEPLRLARQGHQPTARPAGRILRIDMNLSRRAFLNSCSAAGLSALWAAGDTKPNVVFILADDLGWRDTSLYGSKFLRTPNIDALARRGMMFTQAYAAAPLCSATRSSLMTGLYPARTGITGASGHLPDETFEATPLPRARPFQKAIGTNSASRLKLEYYTVAEAFKDAGYRTGHFGKWHLGREPYDPLHQGFDVDIPHWWGPSPPAYLAPWKLEHLTGAPGEHIEDRMAKEASQFIRENKDRPFFLNYWCFSVHGPWQAKPELVEKYRALAQPDNPQHNPVYAAMVESMDNAVGTLMRTLDETGLAKNTIVVFTSDNGGVDFADVGGVPVTSNSPLRAGKATLYEGGIREPAVVIWPGKIKAGSKTNAVISSVDYYPTLLEMTGVSPKQKVGFDGRSFVAALEGKPYERGPLFWHFPHYTPATGNTPCTAVRDGDWKLIRFWCEGQGQDDRLELYNLSTDMSEAHDVSAANPDKVRELAASMEQFLTRTKAVRPRRNPNYDPKAKADPPPAREH